MLVFAVLFIAAFLAGAQNALAGGGSFLTFPALLLTGLDPRAANITSTVALFPGQIATGYAGRTSVAGLPTLSFRALFIISLIGGALGALLLLATPVSVFTGLVPWLILFATLVFVWGSFFRKPVDNPHPPTPLVAGFAQFVIAIYGGYFGGGIGILMLASLTIFGQAVRNAGATKNVLAGVMNASAVLIFLFSHDVAWKQTLLVAVAAIAGGQLGAYALNRVNEKILRVCIAVLGFVLTIAMFWRAT
ncbi:MAG: putative rane transporter protein [Verrucomicrobiaceae bacterium]|nr:putative rane transporter protein [Verrucomicrobiaceae bacterium]